MRTLHLECSSLPKCLWTIQQCVYMYCLCFVIQLPPVLPHMFGTYKEVTGVSVLPPHCVFHQPVLGVINKDCIQAECLSSSRKSQERITNSPPSNTVSYSSLPIGPVHEWTPMNKCCHPLRLNNSCSHCWPGGLIYDWYWAIVINGDISFLVRHMYLVNSRRLSIC